MMSIAHRSFPSSRSLVHHGTPTGKSAAILCSALAWQRYHYQKTAESVKIIYCSRTHSQVAQMVASLQKTPYRPSMTVLGSRDRMCIHAAIQDKNINHECRARKKETEAVRKWQIQSEDFVYLDENPPAQLETDDLEAPMQDESTSTEQKPTCPHYRQLGASRTADNMIQSFRPSGNANADGDESTKDGTFDIEDLVQFGKNPYKRTIVLKKRPEERWGILLSLKVGAQYPHAENVLPSGRAAKSGAIKKGDLIFSYNNRSTAFPDIQALGRRNESLFRTTYAGGRNCGRRSFSSLGLPLLHVESSGKARRTGVLPVQLHSRSRHS